MKKNKLDHYIKQQIEETPLQPSSTAWNRLEARLGEQENSTPKSNNKWTWMSAAAVLIVGLIGGMFFLNDENINPPTKEITKEVPQSENQNVENIEPKNVLVLDEKRTDKIESKVEETIKPEMKQAKKSIAKVTDIQAKKIESQQISEPMVKTILPEIIEPKPIELAQQKDSLKTLKKKNSNYVDPEMLLYSIENKENIKNTKEENNNRLVIFDFNK